MADGTGHGGGSRPRVTWPRLAVTVLLVAAAAQVLVASLLALLRRALRPHPMTPFVAPQYWLSYDEGFVRRALPGAVLHLLAAGRDPGYASVKAVGVGLSVLAVVAVLGLALALARRAPDRSTALLVLVAVVVSPLGLSLYARDVGRTDAVGVAVLVALVGLPWHRLSPAAAVAGVAALTAGAVATEEFLVAFVLPVAALVLRSALAGRRHGGLWTLTALLPGAVLALLSAVVPAPPSLLLRASAAARSAGVPAPVPLVPLQGDHDSVSRLKYGLLENMAAYASLLTPEGVLVTTLLWVAVHLAAVGAVWYLLGRSLGDRQLLVVGGTVLLAALALSVVGIDYRRWWALATVASLAAALHLTRRAPASDGRPSAGPPGVVLVVLVGLAAAGLWFQDLPVWPVRTVAELTARAFG